MGRVDPQTHSYPNIDLTDFDANSKISRRHAKIVWQANGPVLVNLSANGCRVRFDDDGGNAQLCSESMALHGKGVIVLASVSGQSPTGDDTVKFSVGSK